MNDLISPLAIAPMIDWTYTHFRVFMRLLAPRALLYTDMQTTGAIEHNPLKALEFDPIEQPVALQLGGSTIQSLVLAAKKAQDAGFVEVNLNLGCPSNKVQAGRFGACMMREAPHVADCIAAMKQAVTIAVTAKTRIGIDHQDSYDFFANFARCLIEAGCDKLIVHARKAWLNGLSPKQNRTIPPINYDFVYQIKQAFPTIPVVINGNINTLDEIHTHLSQVDGVMLGRLACQNPYLLASIHHALYPEIPQVTRQAALLHYLDHMERARTRGVPMSVLLKPIFNLAHGCANARVWKETLMHVQRSGEYAKLHDAIFLFNNVCI